MRTKGYEQPLGFLTLNGDDELTFKAIDEETKVATFDQKAGDYTLGGSLWCVNVTRENDGKNPIFDFTNKAYGKVLDVTVGGYNTSNSDWTDLSDADGVRVADLKHIGGEVAGWEFSPLLGASNASTKMFGYNGSIYDTNKIEERLNDLVVEFLRQYKIDSTSKES